MFHPWIDALSALLSYKFLVSTIAQWFVLNNTTYIGMVFNYFPNTSRYMISSSGNNIPESIQGPQVCWMSVRPQAEHISLQSQNRENESVEEVTCS